MSPSQRDRTFPPTELHFSELKQMARSPAHFRAAYEAPQSATPSMRFGTLVHHALFGGYDVVMYDGERRGNQWKAFKESHPEHVTIATLEEMAAAKRCATAVRACQAVEDKGLLTGDYEQRLAWSAYGLACGGTVDCISGSYVVDLKVTSYAEPDMFGRKAIRGSMHAQLAWYLDGAKANGYDVIGGALIVVEAAPPYVPYVFESTPRVLEDGRARLRSWVERFKVCRAANAWPGYTQAPLLLESALTGEVGPAPDPSEEW